ncbi:class I SAM-dependent methyltransferase [Streptomyces sp. M2CJ-2]|uniref:class I SAM-dependent methyltransferase n=1 Tax=Streptomyces sp. M2CJ-2 TaxID=2803948 RepID=UPI001F4617B3|nr:class I SAM-dependent methyltransferase [Streptomyces sp. M2CJ-2]
MERVTEVPENFAQSADPARVNDYNAFAEAYSAETEDNLVNAYYARPAMVTLAGDVAGRRVLDAGCGSGPLSAALRDRGAVVTGIDASAGMLALARRRLGDDVALHLVDLSDRLPFADGAFDDVVASLVLHYLEDWGPTLAEVRRVLRPGGRLIASVDHPFVAYTIQDPRPDYSATTSYTFDWTFDGRSVPMRFWRKPLHAMTDAFTTAGFRLTVISEPQPDPAARELFPDDFHDLSTKPTFLFFVLEVPSSATGSDDRTGAEHQRSRSRIEATVRTPAIDEQRDQQSCEPGQDGA